MELLIPNIRDECFKDSPSFRASVDCGLKRIREFEDSTKDIADQFSDTIKNGITFACSLQSLSFKLEKFNNFYCGEKDLTIRTNTKRTMKEFSEFHGYIKSFLEVLNSSRKDIVKLQVSDSKLEGLRRNFTKASDTLDSAESKSSAMSRLKVQECQEVDKIRDNARREWENVTGSFLLELGSYGRNRAVDIYAIYGKISKGFEDLYEHGHELALRLSNWRAEMQKEREKMQKMECDLHLNNVEPANTEVGLSRADSNEVNIIIEGYLWRAPKKTWGRWQKRWFTISRCNQDNVITSDEGGRVNYQNYRLACRKKSSGGPDPSGDNSNVNVIVENLRGVTARRVLTNDAASGMGSGGGGGNGGNNNVMVGSGSSTTNSERRWLFELVRSSQGTVNLSTVLLQATNDADADRWVNALRNAGWSSRTASTASATNNDTKSEMWSASSTNSLNALNNTKPNQNHIGAISTSEEKSTVALLAITQLPGNDKCADCRSAKPKWASVNLGVLICTECSGAHRSLGVHVSKVRSITLDNWEPEMLSVMLQLGNMVVNEVYESSEDTNDDSEVTRVDSLRPNEHSAMAARMQWVQQKWAERKFIDKSKFLYSNVDKISTPQQMLFNSLRRQDLAGLFVAVTLGANIDKDENDSSQNRLALHEAACMNFWSGCEYLMLNGGKINLTNETGETALHVAVETESVLCVWLLLKRGAKQTIPDHNGREALQLAIDTANANTVTLLRLQALNDNTKEANLGSSGDETVNNVFSDFTQEAYKQLRKWIPSLASEEMTDRDDTEEGGIRI